MTALAPHKVLIVAADPVLAALVGRMVESARFQPAFPLEDEHVEQALARVRPIAAILLESGADLATSELLLTRARRAGVQVLLFTGDPAARRASGTKHDVPAFVLPDQVDELQFVLDEMARATPRGSVRRSADGVERRSDGALVFNDSEGVRWAAYDRRGPDRRGAVDRRFVNSSGTVLHCEVPEGEAARATSVHDLRKQLARAHRS